MSQTFNPTVLEKGVKGRFIFASQIATMNLKERIAMTELSTSDQEKYAWAGEVDQLEEVVDEVRFSPMSDASYTLANTVYAKGLAIKRTNLDDDQIGMFLRRISDLAKRGMTHPDKLIVQALIDGASATLGLDYTGEAFFNATHAARGFQTATQSNIVTGTGTSTAQVAADLNTAMAQQLNFVDEANEPFHEEVRSYALVAPPALMKALKEAIKAQVIAQTSNVQFDEVTFDFIFTSRLTTDSADDYYLLNTTQPDNRALIFQQRDALELTSLQQESETGFKREQYLYKARARHAVGYALWQNAIKVDNA